MATFKITIPKTFWKDAKTDDILDVDLPSGRFVLTFRLPQFSADFYEWFIGKFEGETIPLPKDQSVTLIGAEAGEGTLALDLDIHGAPLPAIIGVLVAAAGAFGVIYFVLDKVEKVITVSTPLLIGGAVIIVSIPQIRKSIFGK